MLNIFGNTELMNTVAEPVMQLQPQRQVARRSQRGSFEESTKVGNTQFLDFEQERVQPLTLDMLRRTAKETATDGTPLKKLYHYQIMDEMIDAARTDGYNVEVYDLFAANNRDRTLPGVTRLPLVEKRKGERAVEAHIIRRVYANIRLKDFDQDGITTNLAIAYHQKGIEMGFGTNVKVCHNQNILSPSLYAATYKSAPHYRSEKSEQGVYELPELINVAKGWLADAREIVEQQMEMIRRMKAVDVSAQQMLILIGMLNTIRVAVDSSDKRIHVRQTYPMNGSQINKFTERLLIAYHDQQRVSLWDVYNAATDMYKATSMDVPNILPQNLSMFAFLAQNFESELRNA